MWFSENPGNYVFLSDFQNLTKTQHLRGGWNKEKSWQTLGWGSGIWSPQIAFGLIGKQVVKEWWLDPRWNLWKVMKESSDQEVMTWLHKENGQSFEASMLYEKLGYENHNKWLITMWRKEVMSTSVKICRSYDLRKEQALQCNVCSNLTNH